MQSSSAPSLRRQQTYIGIQIVASVAAQLALFTFGKEYFSGVAPESGAMADRLAFVLQWNLLGLCVLAAMILSIAARRPLSLDVIDGNDHANRLAVQVRIQRNTLEQFIWMVFGHLALAVSLPLEAFAVFPTYVIMFVLFRICFWIGYSIRPDFRTFGFADSAGRDNHQLLW